MEKANREIINELSDHDVTVNKVHMLYIRNEVTYEEMLILMVKALSEERNNYLQELMKYKRQYG